MNKKILTSLLFAGLLVGFSGCKAADPNDKVLKDEESAAWVLHGNIKLEDGTDNGWNGKDSDLYRKSALKAVSINEVSKVDAAVGAKLKERNVKYLYMYEGAQLGMADVGWSVKYHDTENLYKTSGSYSFKAAKVSWDEEEDVYAEELWMPDPKKSHMEPLTDNIFLPPWQEASDEWGFSWSNDLCVTGGAAGKYTLVFAQYDVAQSATVPGFGMAAIRTEAATGGQGVETLTKFIVADHTYGIVGSFNDWGGSADVAMTLADGVYSGVVELDAGAEFKVRADSAWDYNWGAEILDVEHSMEGLPTEGNLKVETAGSYLVTIEFTEAESYDVASIAKITVNPVA